MDIHTGAIEILEDQFEDIETGWIAGAEALLPGDDGEILAHDWDKAASGRVMFCSSWGGNLDLHAGWLHYVDGTDEVTTLTTPDWYAPTVSVSSSRREYLYVKDVRYVNDEREALAEDYLMGRVSKKFMKRLDCFAKEAWNESYMQDVWMTIARGESERQGKQLGVPSALLDGTL